MPKKKKLTEPEIHALILKDVKVRIGCSDFAPEFTLHKTQDEWANWDVGRATRAEC